MAGGPLQAYVYIRAGTGRSRRGGHETPIGEAEGGQPWDGEALCWVTLEEPQMWPWGLLLKLGVTLAVQRGRLKRWGFRLGQEGSNPDGMEGREGTENRKLDHRGGAPEGVRFQVAHPG